MKASGNSSIARQSLHALIVEDDPKDAERIALELRRAGFELSWSGSKPKQIIWQVWSAHLKSFWRGQRLFR